MSALNTRNSKDSPEVYKFQRSLVTLCNSGGVVIAAFVVIGCVVSTCTSHTFTFACCSYSCCCCSSHILLVFFSAVFLRCFLAFFAYFFPLVLCDDDDDDDGKGEEVAAVPFMYYANGGHTFLHTLSWIAAIEVWMDVCTTDVAAGGCLCR